MNFFLVFFTTFTIIFVSEINIEKFLLISNKFLLFDWKYLSKYRRKID